MEKEKKHCNLNFRLLKSEKEIIELKAKGYKMNVSQYIKFKILGIEEEILKNR